MGTEPVTGWGGKLPPTFSQGEVGASQSVSGPESLEEGKLRVPGPLWNISLGWGRRGFATQSLLQDLGASQALLSLAPHLWPG